jgi:hypothetical protein
LIDGEPNASNTTGSDVHVVSKTNPVPDITGVDNHKIPRIAIGTVGSVAKSQKGPTIAMYGGQHEDYKLNVNDKLIKENGGLQHIKTIDGCMCPIDIINSLLAY